MKLITSTPSNPDKPKSQNQFSLITETPVSDKVYNPVGGFRGTASSRFLTGLTNDSNPYDVKAANQGFWSELGNSLVNFGGEVVLGAVEGAGYLNPLQLITTAFDSEKEYGNVISEWARKKNDELQQELFPVYNNSQTSDISEWFFENLPSIGSAVSLMIPAMVGTKALGGIGKLARGKHLLKGIGVLEGTPAYNAVTGGLETITMAGMSRHAENMMESTETYNKILEEAKAKGFSDDYAKKAAKEAAQSVYNKNWNLIMNDIVQFGMINKGWSTYSRMAKEMATSQTNKITAGSILKQMGIEGAEEGYQFITAEEEARRVAQKYDIRDKDYLTYPERLAKYMVNEDFLTSVFFGALGGGVFEIAGKSVENKLAKQQQLKEELVNGELNKLVSAFQGDKRKFDRERQIDTYRLIFHGLQQGRADQIETAFQQMVDTKPANELSEQETKDINEAGRFGLEKLKKLEEFYNTRRSNNTAETMQFLLGNEATKELTQQDIKYFSDLQTRELDSLATENNLGADMQKLLLLTKEVEELKKLTPKDLNIEENVYNSLIKTKEEQLLPFLDTVKVNYSLTDEQIKEKLKTVDTSVFSTLSNFKVQSEARYNQQVADGKLADTTEGKVKLAEKQSEIKKEVTDKKFQELVKVIQPNTDEEQLIKAKEQAKEIGKEKEFNAAYEKKFRELQLASSKFNKAEVETSLKARWTNNELVKNREQQYIMNMLLQTGGLPEDSILNEEFIAEKYATNPAFATKLDTYYKNANAVIVTTKKEAEKVPVDSSGPDANAQAQSQKKAENNNLSPANPWISAGIQFKYDFSKREFISDENGFVSNDSSLTAAINWKALNQGEVKIGSTINFDFDFNDSFNQGKVKGFEKIDAYNALIFITYYSKENPNTPITLGAVPVWSETKNFGTPEKSKELKAFREKIWSEIQSNKTKSGRITLTPTTSLKAYESGDFYNLRKDGQPLKQNPLNVLRKEHKFVLGIGRQKTTGETYLDFGDASHPYVDKVTAISKIEPGKIYMMVPSLSGSILPVKIFNENLNSFPELMNTVNSLIQEVQNITDPEQKSSLVDRISEIISINNLSYNPETKLYSLIVGPKKEPQTLTFTTEDINQNIGNLRVQIDIGKINKTVNGQPYNKVIADNGYITTDLHPDYFHSSRVVLQPIAINVIQPDQKVDAKVTEKLPDITSSLNILNLDNVEGIDLDLGDPGKFKVAEDDLVGTLNEQKLRQWFSKNLPQVPLEVVPHLIEIRKNGPKAWGMFKNAAVVLYNAAPHKIGYHEAFHAVFNLFLSKPEQEAILNEASQESGITRSYDTNNQSPRFAAVEYQLKATLGVEIEEKPQGVEAKAGVSELFESNPELANAVYEALGFSQNNVEAQKRIDLAYKQLDETRKYVSFEMLNDPEDAEPGDIIYIDDISTEKTQRKKGYATSTYIYIGEQLLKQGLRFQSTSKLTAENTIWENLYKLGLATKKESNASTIGYVYEYIGLQNQITPQQKQQALQLYSQYLDTIFPDSKVKDIVYHGSGQQFEKFLKEKLSQSPVIHFSKKKDWTGWYKFNYPVLLNIKKLYDYGWLDRKDKEKDTNLPAIEGAVLDNFNESDLERLTNQGYDGAFGYGQITYEKGVPTDNLEYVVFEPEQIHILGSKEDIEGFKEFLNETTKTKVKEGVSELFESNPELATIGTQEQYSQYLDTIFPDSKVKDIVYHGSHLSGIEKFDFTKQRTNLTNYLPKGGYFTSEKLVANSYSDVKGKIYSVLLNIKNPRIIQGNEDYNDLSRTLQKEAGVYKKQGITNKEITDALESLNKEIINNNDGIIFLKIKDSAASSEFKPIYNYGELSYNEDNENTYVVFEPEQIHILGNKQDIKRFKEFVQNKQSITPRKGISELFAENPQLASIGTQEQYERYLSTIFPNSKVKDIVYHGNTGEKIESRTGNNIGIWYNTNPNIAREYNVSFDSFGVQSLALYKEVISNPIFTKYVKNGELSISKDKEFSKLYDAVEYVAEVNDLSLTSIQKDNLLLDLFNEGKKAYNKPLTISILNLQNPITVNGNNKTVFEIEENLLKLKSNSIDGFIIKDFKEANGSMQGDNYVVFKPEQIHILSSKQDIEGFKSFIKSNLKQVEYQQVNLTKKQRNEIIRLSTTDQSVYTTNDLKLEEYLADKLMNYIMEDQVNEGSLMYNIRQFFRKLWSTIKSIFNSKVDIDTLFYRINTGYYKGAALPASANQERYKVVEDPIIAKRRVGMINYQFFSVLDNLRNNNPLYTNLTDSEIIRKIGNTDSKIIRKIGNDHIKEGLIAVYSRVLKGLQKAEFGLPETDSRKAKLKSIIDQFFIINSDNEISDKDGYFGKALKDLTRYGFTVTPEGETNLQVLEDIENKTFDELYEEETSDQIYNKTKLNENPKDNLSYEVRKVLRRLERYIYKNGEFITGVSETNDDLGFKSFADYDEVVNYLNANLANINDSDEMVDKLKELQYDRPELHGLLIKVLENPQFKTQFFVSLNKAYVAYLKVLRRERKIYSADPFGEEETDIQMQVINMNRKGLSQLIIDDWNVNLLNSQGNNITTDNKIDTTKAKQYLEQYEQILKEIVSLKQEKLPLEYANKLSENLKNFGIIIDPQVFVRQYEKDNASVKVNDVKKNKEPKTPQESFNVLTKGKDSILSILKAISVGNNPYEGDTIESSTIRKVAYSVAANSLHLHQDSIINVEGEQQYSYVLPSFLTNLVNRLKSQEYRESLLNNWWFKHNSFLKELNLEENYDLRDQFGVAIFGGNQLSQGYGKSYRKLTVKDLAIADITLYFNNGNSEYANYRVPILSDSPTSVVYKFKKYDQEKIIDGLYAIALAEKERIDLTSNTNYDINVWSQRGKEYHFLDIFNNSDIDINNEPQAKEAIKNWLDSEFENEKRRLEDLGIYRKDNFFSSYLDTRLSTASKEDLIKNYFYNKVHANANIIQLTSVDLAFYKGAINFQKRNGQISKLTQRLDTKAVWKDGTAVGEQYKSIYLTDLKTNTELFEGVNVTDAQSYITLDRYKKIMIGLGQWTDKHENVFQKAKKGAWSADFVDFIPSSLKPFMFGHETFANTDITIPVQHKNSQVLLIPAFAKGNSTLQKILDFMGDTIDELEFADSAVKVGAYGAVSIEEFLKGKEPVIHVLNNKDWGIQQTVPAKHLDVEVLLGTQIKKLALSDLPDDIEIMGMNKQQLFETYQKLLTDNIIDSYNNLVGEFTNIEKVQELLLKQVRDRGLSESYEDALKIVVDQKGNKVFNIPLFDPIHGRRMQNILNAIVRNNVTKQKIKGGSLSLVSSFGLSKKLNIVRDKNGAVEYMEVMLPAYTRKLFSKKGKNGEVNIKEIQEESPEILDLVGYRIPTEGWHSIKKLRIVGFTPEIMGGVALLPYDITTIAGEDFDIDKMYVILPNVEEVDGKLRKVKYNLSKELNKTQRDNAILDIISEIYSHPSMGKTVLTPGGFDTLKILMRDIESRYGVLIPSDNILLPSVEARYFDINSNGGNLIGIAANHNSSYALFQYSDLALQTPITIDGNSLSSLHTTDSLDPNRTVGKNLSEFLAAFVDTAKDPVATGLNLNTFTFDTVALLVRLGFDLKTAMYFINQPILKKLVKDYTNQGSGEKTLEKIVDEIRTAYKEVLGELPKPGRYFLKTSKLEEYLTNIEFIPDQTAKKEAMRYQMLVLETFLNIRKDATALSALIGATKADTHGTGKTLAENVYYLQAANNAVSLDSLVGVDSVLNIPLIETSLEYGIEKPQKELLGKYFPYDGELFKKLINVAQINKGERLTEEETNYLFNNYIHYFVSNFDAFDETKRSYYLNKYPEQFVALKNTYNNLELVKYLAVKEPDKFNRVRRIEFTSTATISAEQIEKLQAAWMSMLGSDNAEIKKLAYDLLNYTFFSNYFGFKYSGFSHLVPTQILENLVNKEGVTYRDFVYKLQDEKRSTHTIKNYLNQLYRHQHDFNSLVTRVNRSSVSLVKKTKDNFVTSLLLNEDKARELQLHDEDGVIKKEYLSYKNTDGVVYTFAYAGHTSKNEVVYNIQSNLGYDDKIVEFSRLNTIKSVLLINHLPKFEKSDFFDTTQDYSPLYSIDETNKEVEKADENLNNILKGFASSLGITIADHENLKTRLGTNAKGLADIYNKLILISQGNQDINTLPEEVGHFAEAYSRNTMFHSRLMELVSNTDEYKEVLQQYGELYNNDETLLRRETIGKLIGKAIVKRYKETRNKTNNIILQFLEALWNNFIKIFRRVNASDFNKEIGTITDMIAEKILAGEVDIFTDINVKIGEKFYRLGNTVDVNEALNVLEKSIKSIYKKIELYNTKLSPDYLQQEKNIQEKLLKNYNNENYKLGLLQYVANARIELGVVAQRYNQISNLLIDGEIPQELDKKRELIKSLRGAKNYIDGFSNSLKEIASLELFTKEVNDKIKATYATTLALNNDYITLSRKLLVDLFKEYATNPIIKQDLENAISYLDNDITYGRALFDSLAESTDGILEIMDKITKDFINKYRIEMLNKAKEVVDLQRQLERDGFKSTNWMYERDFEGNLTGYYVSKWNIGQYEKARKAFFDSIGKRPTNKEKQREWSRKVSEWFNENNQTNPNYKELLSSKKEEFISKFGERIGLREYNAWVAKNTKEFINPETGNYEIKYIKELAIPSDKYLSRQYKEIQENSNLKKYYDKYLEILNEADKQMPGAYKLHGKMPQVRKDFFERLAFVDKDGSRRLKSPKEYLEEGKDTLLDAFRKQDGADTEFGLAKLTNEKGEVVNFVPAFYTKRIDSNMLSTDASSALIAYLNSAYNFKAMDKLVDIAEMTKDVLAEREVATGNFDPLATKFNKLIGKPGKQKITIKGAESKAFNRYVAYMEMVVYGMQKKDGSFAKIADTLNTYTSLSALAVNAYAGVANLLYGNTMLTMEAFAGELINKKDMLEASKIYTTELPDAIKDIGARNVSSKINLWSEYMNTLQDYNRELKDANTGRSSIFSRLFTQSSLYFTNKAGEHMMQLQGSLALANRVKVKDSTGQIMNLWEAFEVINVGTEENPSYRLKLKDGLTKVSGTGTDLFTKAEDGKPLTEKDINRFINRQNFFNKRLHGIYNDVDKASIQRYAIGRMALLFRRWIKPGWNRRFEKLTYNEEGEVYTEGYYYTTYRFFKNLITGLAQAKDKLAEADQDQEKLTATEKANLIRAGSEFAFLLATATLASLATSLADDDEDNWVYAFVAYELLRVHSELQFYSNPQEFGRILKSPLPAMHQLEKLNRLVRVWNWNDEIKRGKYEGLKQYEVVGIELVPLTGTYFNFKTPEEQLKYFTNNPPVFVSLTNEITK